MAWLSNVNRNRICIPTYYPFESIFAGKWLKTDSTLAIVAFNDGYPPLTYPFTCHPQESLLMFSKLPKNSLGFSHMVTHSIAQFGKFVNLFSGPLMILTDKARAKLEQGFITLDYFVWFEKQLIYTMNMSTRSNKNV